MAIPAKLAAYGQREESVTEIPLAIIVLHKLARLGMADRYAPGSKRFLQFDAEKHQVVFNKWDQLKQAERVTIIYREKEDQCR